MRRIISLFSPAPYIPEIEDQEVVKSTYKYWRLRILYSMAIGYAFYYFTRKSFTFAMPGMIKDLGFEMTDLGILVSVLNITYGISKFGSSIISDRSNPRYFMAVGLFLTGVCNILFGLSSSFFLFAIFWGLNGWFQGFGWPPCARCLTHWYSQSERGTWWSTWNVSHNVGSIMIPWIVGACLYFFDWRMAMYVPGVICILGSLFLLNRLRDTPQSMGLPPIEKFRNDYVGSHLEADGTERELTTYEILVEYVLKNKFIWVLAITYFFVYFVRTAMSDWTVLFLTQQKNYSAMGASGCISLLEIGGFLGSLSAGLVSDRLFQARRGPVIVLYALGMAAAIGLFWCVPPGYLWLDSGALFLIGFAIFGPQMLIGMFAAELAHKKAAATASGFAGLCAYIGAASAGYPLSLITMNFGWDGFFLALAGSSLISALLLAPLWNVKERKLPKKVAAKLDPEPA